jgi:sugar/nucleoside kinase (ribokinase family)
MTITVIGHVCFDVIEYPTGDEIQSYGGIFFSVAALANLLGQNDKVFPVFGIGKSDYDSLIERLQVYPNVDTSGIFKFNGPTNQVRLLYSSKEKRIECSKQISEPIPWKRIRPFLESDMILINMISGFDITLETLDEIRMEIREKHTPIYLDVHCLACGINPDFTRFFRPIDTWRRWFFMLHGVQMNDDEAANISPERSDNATLAKHILALNTKTLHITRGEHGTTVFINENKNIKRSDIAGIEPENAVDTTGCGDVFSAAYCSYYLKKKDIIASTEFANKVASFNTRIPGSKEIDRLSLFNLEKDVLQERLR